MKKAKFLLLSGLILLSACSEETDIPSKIPENTTETPSTADNSLETVRRGVVKVKVKERVNSRYCAGPGESLSMTRASDPIIETLSSIGATSMTRSFPADGNMDKSLEYRGMNRWYTVRFDISRDVDEVIEELRENPDFEYVQKVYNIRPLGHHVPEVCISHPMESNKEASPFDDPGIDRQWHYNNDGSIFENVESHEAGREYDIRLFDAWKKETGRPDVIVGVVDGGIYWQHEDINANMWINEKEIPGDGIDNDGNGYVDDIYGWNTCRNNGDIYPDEALNPITGKVIPQGHGTHVSGTIAAVNNNGKGVCGVAGGNGDADSGVRLMSCMIFGHASSDPAKNDEGDPAVAIYYAAKNGAVIINNSWGFTFNPMKPDDYPKETPQDIKDAIDYFIKHAGCDKDGNQRADSPMKGGVVIFAAGNDNKEFLALPSAEENVIAVSSIGPDYTRASYSNYGTWCDIAAPGGEFDIDGDRGQVYSTLPDNRYGYMAGTSMACPHVTGVAALICSKFGGQGFTNEDLKQRLLTSINDQDIDQMSKGNGYVGYEGKLGTGYLDAEVALAEDKGIAPGQVGEIKAAPAVVYVDLEWTAVADEDDARASQYEIKLTSDKDEKSKTVWGRKAGQRMQARIDGLWYGTTYKVEITAADRWGNKAPAGTSEFTTGENQAPIITGMPEEIIRVNENLSKTFTINVSDPEQQDMTSRLEGLKEGVTMSPIDEEGNITIKVEKATDNGTYTSTIVIADNFGFETKKEFTIEVYQYKKPEYIGGEDSLNQFVVLEDKMKEIDLSTLFSYDPEFLAQSSFTVRSSDTRVATVRMRDKTNLAIMARRAGHSKFTITVNDGNEGGVTTQEIDIYVVEKEKVEDGSPVLMMKQIDNNNIQVVMNPQTEKATLSLRTAAGTKIWDEAYKKTTGTKYIVNIQLTDYAPGTYRLMIDTDRGTVEKLFVKL